MQEAARAAATEVSRVRRWPEFWLLPADAEPAYCRAVNHVRQSATVRVACRAGLDLAAPPAEPSAFSRLLLEHVRGARPHVWSSAAMFAPNSDIENGFRRMR